MALKLIDCTLRDGGYYNNWDFSRKLIIDYLNAMHLAKVDYVELGFRSLKSDKFRGACAYTTDEFVLNLPIPDGLKIGVMVNAEELIKHPTGPVEATKLLFSPATASPVSLVRLACHFKEFENMALVCAWLKENGYEVGINLMQAASRSEDEIKQIGKLASQFSIDVLYFADSLGNLDTERVTTIIQNLRVHWKGELGIHTHDNMGRALVNTIKAVSEGVTWVDSTVTGMGRGAGNAQTEYVLLELQQYREKVLNLSPLLELIKNHFEPMKVKHKWGSNVYYYLAAQSNIHPTYVQEMLNDPRYNETDILSVIEHLREVGGSKFSASNMEVGRKMYSDAPAGDWAPSSMFKGKELLIIGSGQGVTTYRDAIEYFIRKRNLSVIALNTQTNISPELINVRVACHPFRLLADCETYKKLPQPVILPLSRVPETVRDTIAGIDQYNFDVVVRSDTYEFYQYFAIVPMMLAMAYALAVATSGEASRIFLAGFDGFGATDPRTIEMENLFSMYSKAPGSLPILSITPTQYNIPSASIYAIRDK